MVQHTLFLNSSYAVKLGENGIETLLPADAQGNITALTGDVLVFKDSYSRNICVTDIMFKTQETPLMITFNDIDQYTYVVPAGSQQGISGLPIYKFKLLNDCSFSYDALA